MFRQSEVLINETEYSQNEELANIMSIEGSATVENVDMNILDLFEKNIDNGGPFGFIEKECVEYVAGYVAHRYIYKYPYLKSGEDYNIIQETSWIQHISKGNLTIPSPTLVNAAHELEQLFKELHGDALKNKPNIIKDL
ncbi:unnamed protein product [Macrosiphum euphorbiae]|uniref:Uncharacterized protein n=1 Tax=Macrosiphum euphorbiae TaxID=13131 RepID=A0AAV0WGU3_9HEMI|nr:unnamed protein product [Macrosiphum euphorbiae]